MNIRYILMVGLAFVLGAQLQAADSTGIVAAPGEEIEKPHVGVAIDDLKGKPGDAVTKQNTGAEDEEAIVEEQNDEPEGDKSPDRGAPVNSLSEEAQAAALYNSLLEGAMDFFSNPANLTKGFKNFLGKDAKKYLENNENVKKVEVKEVDGNVLFTRVHNGGTGTIPVHIEELILLTLHHHGDELKKVMEKPISSKQYALFCGLNDLVHRWKQVIRKMNLRLTDADRDYLGKLDTLQNVSPNKTEFGKATIDGIFNPPSQTEEGLIMRGLRCPGRFIGGQFNQRPIVAFIVSLVGLYFVNKIWNAATSSNTVPYGYPDGEDDDLS